ncbi:radical SAM protein [Citrobacter freundii]|nr:radical SAM protein [Citrobacter freundii]MBC6506581.1 radical SAM protein [Citrobacter freundii]
MVANFRPQHLTVQWHITDSCNLRCQHCYQPGYEGKRNSLAELKEIAEQILHFHQQLAGPSPLPFLLTLTGGEPFAHPDFIKLLQFLDEHLQRPNIAILTNGTLLTETRLKLIAPIRLAFIQLSVDGDSSIHDEIRGTGNFSRVLETTKRLKAEGRRVLWSFTAHKKTSEVLPLLQIWPDAMR